MLDRTKVLNWWVGRLSDQDLADWTGMAKRAVGIVLGLDNIKTGIVGGGRGSKNTRRISQGVRNSVAIIQAMNEAGLTFEAAANIISATPRISHEMNRVIDYSPPLSGEQILLFVEPDKGWLPIDIVPQHIWFKHIIPCRAADDLQPGAGDIFRLNPNFFQPNTDRGSMIWTRPDHLGEEKTIEFVPLTQEPVYDPEWDDLGLYMKENTRSDSIDFLDDHLLIVDSRFVFHRQPTPSPTEAMLTIGNSEPREKLTFWHNLISIIEPDKKTVRISCEKDEHAANYYLKNPSSLLDINMTLNVRKMKRRAYGLDIDIE